MFITQNDYRSVCTVRELDILQQSDTETREEAEQTAMEEVAGYLRSRYDVGKIYDMEGDERNKHLVAIICNVALFYLVQSLPQGMAGEKRVLMYERAIEWLSSVQAGKVSPDLPLNTESAGGSFPIAFGGMKRNTYDY